MQDVETFVVNVRNQGFKFTPEFFKFVKASGKDWPPNKRVSDQFRPSHWFDFALVGEPKVEIMEWKEAKDLFEEEWRS